MAQMIKQDQAENQDLASGIASLTGIQTKALTKTWEDNNTVDQEETKSLQNTSGDILPFKQGTMKGGKNHIAE